MKPAIGPQSRDLIVRDRTEADFSHGICPDCAKRLYPDHYKKTT